MKILLTGCAGFIGHSTAKQLLNEGNEIIGIDNINEYYDVNLKNGRLEDLGIDVSQIDYGKPVISKLFKNLEFIKLDIEDLNTLKKIFTEYKFEKVINLAAQAGVRYSLENPYAYIQSNVVGFLNILECCRNFQIKHLIYASSSSVYGMNSKIPFSEDDLVNKPVSLYAATKVSNELMAYSYNHTYKLRTTGLRFFTVYGPWGRPDMAPYIFVNSIINSIPINVFNHGKLSRDFTFIDDITEGLSLVVNDRFINHGRLDTYEIYNIGSSKPIELKDFILTLEQVLNKKAFLTMLPMQPGDVYQTYSDSRKLYETYGFQPKIELSVGLRKFVLWFKHFYNLD